MKILIVDDVDYIRKSILKVLSENGFTCETCENGKVAIERLQSSSFDMVITDIMMPDMDGFELLDFLRDEKNKLSRVPVLAISGGSKTINSDLVLSLINDKADAILQKPFAKADLLNAIAKIIGKDKLSAVMKGSTSLEVKEQ